jgi:hypothetical protein
MKTFEDYLEIASTQRIDEVTGFDAETNPYIKKMQDDKKRMNPVTFKALYDDMWEILGEDDPRHGFQVEDGMGYDYEPLSHSKENHSDVFTGTMDEFEKFFASRGITGEAFINWFNNSTERIGAPFLGALGSYNSKSERRPLHTRGANSYLKSIR